MLLHSVASVLLEVLLTGDRQVRGDPEWKRKGEWDLALRLGSSPFHGNRAQISCGALLGSGGTHKVHHLCSLLPQPKPSWRGVAVFSDRSLAILSAGKCSSPETALPLMCCIWLAPSFAGREPLAAVNEEVSKDLLHG